MIQISYCDIRSSSIGNQNGEPLKELEIYMYEN